MSETPTSDWTWINDAADRFERAWKQGARPRIEDYLTEVDEPSRVALLEELLRVELELLRRAGEEPVVAEYAARFCEHAAYDRSRFRCRFEPIHPIEARAADDRAGRDSRPNRRQRRADCRQPRPLLRRLRDHTRDRRGGMGVVFQATQISLSRRWR